MQPEYLVTAQVQARYGRRGRNTLARWIADTRLNFPRPEYIRGRLYWRVAELDAWDKSRKQPEGEAA